MTKSELRTGMIVTHRNGNRRIVYDNVCVQSKHDGDSILMDNIGSWNNLHNYNEDLTHRQYSYMDIVKIEIISMVADMHKPFDAPTLIIWERPEPRKKITISEIEKLLGYKVEIINDN